MAKIALEDRKRWPLTWGIEKPSRQFGDGRRCSKPGCPTFLSRYNPSSECSVHERELSTDKLAEEHRH